MRIPIDIKDMARFNPEVTNGIDSVSKGLVSMKYIGFFPKVIEWGPGPYIDFTYQYTPYYTPYCKFHGAMLRVSKDGIYRCGELGCDTGCYCP